MEINIIPSYNPFAPNGFTPNEVGNGEMGRANGEIAHGLLGFSPGPIHKPRDQWTSSSQAEEYLVFSEAPRQDDYFWDMCLLIQHLQEPGRDPRAILRWFNRSVQNFRTMKKIFCPSVQNSTWTLTIIDMENRRIVFCYSMGFDLSLEAQNVFNLIHEHFLSQIEHSDEPPFRNFDEWHYSKDDWTQVILEYVR
jgi:hypothetical protein